MYSGRVFPKQIGEPPQGPFCKLADTFLQGIPQIMPQRINFDGLPSIPVNPIKILTQVKDSHTGPNFPQQPNIPTVRKIAEKSRKLFHLG